MKNIIKKKAIILCAACAVLIGSSAVIFAAPDETVRPIPGSSQTNSVTSSGTSADNETSAGNYRATNSPSDAQSSGDSESGVTRDVPTAIPVSNSDQVNIVTDTEKTSGSKGSVSIGAMILWLLVSVIINAVISFWIGNRFYRLSKKDTHITAEIRALRRDVEEKFIGSVGGFTEQAMDIDNSNGDYSMNDEGITMTRRQRAEAPQAEEDDMLKKWESRQQTRRPSQRDSFERRRKYQPTREELEPEIEDYEEDEEAESPIKSKAKEILGDIFPFKED